MLGSATEGTALEGEKGGVANSSQISPNGPVRKLETWDEAGVDNQPSHGVQRAQKIGEIRWASLH